MSKRVPFKYPKWKLSSQMNSAAFVKIINWNLFLGNLEFLKKLKFPSYVTWKF